MLKFENVCFCYKSEPVFYNFNLCLNENEVTAVLGHSGCGKTTFMELACGMLKPSSGSITPFSANRPSYIFQENRLLPQSTAAENLAFVGAAAERSAEYIRKTGLSGNENKLPGELSGGMSRRLAIARALAFGGDCFFIDEPLHGLDIKTSREILLLMREELCGKTALIITHSPEEAFLLCDRILIAGGPPFRISADIRKDKFESLEEFKKFVQSMI